MMSGITMKSCFSFCMKEPQENGPPPPRPPRPAAETPPTLPPPRVPPRLPERCVLLHICMSTDSEHFRT